MLLGRDDHGCSLVMGAGAGVEVLVAGGPNTARAEIFSPAGVAWREAARLAHQRAMSEHSGKNGS